MDEENKLIYKDGLRRSRQSYADVGQLRYDMRAGGFNEGTEAAQLIYRKRNRVHYYLELEDNWYEGSFREQGGAWSDGGCINPGHMMAYDSNGGHREYYAWNRNPLPSDPDWDPDHWENEGWGCETHIARMSYIPILPTDPPQILGVNHFPNGIYGVWNDTWGEKFTELHGGSVSPDKTSDPTNVGARRFVTFEGDHTPIIEDDERIVKDYALHTKDPYTYELGLYHRPPDDVEHSKICRWNEWRYQLYTPSSLSSHFPYCGFPGVYAQGICVSRSTSGLRRYLKVENGEKKKKSIDTNAFGCAHVTEFFFWVDLNPTQVDPISGEYQWRPIVYTKVYTHCEAMTVPFGDLDNPDAAFLELVAEVNSEEAAVDKLIQAIRGGDVWPVPEQAYTHPEILEAIKNKFHMGSIADFGSRYMFVPEYRSIDGVWRYQYRDAYVGRNVGARQYPGRPMQGYRTQGYGHTIDFGSVSGVHLWIHIPGGDDDIIPGREPEPPC